jgi:type IV pilus assembly protein PilF
MVDFLGKKIFKVLFVTAIVMTLSACVSQNYKDDKTPIIASEANNSEIAMTRISLGLGYLKMGNTTQAKLNLEKAKRAAPNLPQIYTAFAHYYDTVGEPEQAIIAYEKALSLKSDDADTLNNYGVFLCRQGRADEAEKQLLKAIQVPTYLLVSQSYENIALCQLKNNNFDKAEKYLKKSIEHNPNNTSALINMARLQYAKGNYKAAEKTIKHFEKATRRFQPEALALAFKIYQKLAQPKAAKSYAAMLVKMYPQSYQAKQYLLNELAGTDVDTLAATYRKVMASKRFAMAPSSQKRVIKLSPKSTIGSAKISLAKHAKKPISKPVTQKNTEASTSVLANKKVPDLTSAANVIHALPTEQALPAAILSTTVKTAAKITGINDNKTDTAKTAKTPDENQTKVVANNTVLLAKTTTDALSPQLANKQQIESIVEHAKQEKANVTTVNETQVLKDDEIASLVDDTIEDAVIISNEEKKSLSLDDITTKATVSLNEEIAVDEAEQLKTANNDSDLLVDNVVDESSNKTTPITDTEIAIKQVINNTDDSAAMLHTVTDAEIDQMISDGDQSEALVQESDKVVVNDSVTATVNEETDEKVAEAALLDDKTSPNEVYHSLEALPVHKVKSGENLFKISRKYNIRIRTLRKWNKLTEKSILHVGDTIYLADPDSVVTNK